MASRVVINERLKYVRKHITDGQAELGIALGVSKHTAKRYKRHIKFGEPLSGKYRVRQMQAKKARVVTIPQMLHSIEDKVDTLSEKLDRVVSKKKRHFFWSD